MNAFEREFNLLRDWFFDAALPLWSTRGVDRATGGFIEKLTPAGEPTNDSRRARVVGRQIFSFATAVNLGWSGPGREIVRHGLQAIEAQHLRCDAVVPLVAPGGLPLSEQFDLYDQAFILFGLAAAAGIGERKDALSALALRLKARMTGGWKHPTAGYEESSPRTLPLRANPHMHLFEASLAWEEAGGDTSWYALADEIAELCLAKFLDAETGALHEYFDADWQVISTDGLDVVEPGHQFEWAWLLIRWGLARKRPDAIAAARRLIAIAENYGVNPTLGLAMNELNADLSIRDPLLRLWPQTERIKAYVALGRISETKAEAASCEEKIAEAARGLRRYLDHPVGGAWWEHLDVSGHPLQEPSRGSSLYHITYAIVEMARHR